MANIISQVNINNTLYDLETALSAVLKRGDSGVNNLKQLGYNAALDPDSDSYIADAFAERPNNPKGINLNYGDTSVVFGDTNINRGTSSVIAGSFNTAEARAGYSIMVGNWNTNGQVLDANNVVTSDGANSIIAGHNNVNYARSSVIAGNNNINYGQDGWIAGYHNQIYSGTNNCAVLGRNNELWGKDSLVVGSGNVFGKTAGQPARIHGNALVTGAGNTVDGAGGITGGYQNKNDHYYNIVCGQYLQTSRDAQAVFGKYNANNTDALLIVGCGTGTSTSARKNAFTVTASGATVNGSLTTGSLTTTGGASIGSTLTVSSATTLNGNLTANGTTTLYGQVRILEKSGVRRLRSSQVVLNNESEGAVRGYTLMIGSNSTYGTYTALIGTDNLVAENTSAATALLVGTGLTARHNNFAAIGTYNIKDYTRSAQPLFAVGNGSSNTSRSDAFTVYADGRLEAAGDVVEKGVALEDKYARKSDLESLVIDQQYSVTYSELKQLRSVSALIPGASYRITDYTAILSDSVEAGQAWHPFDIIVQAVSNDTLSEIAKADHHYIDARTYILDDSVILGSNMLKANSVIRYYDVYEDFGGSSINNEGPAPYKEGDVFVAYTYGANNEGHVVPVLYKTDPDEEPDPDYGDEFYYVGVEEIDGVEYDKWRKIAESYEGGPFWTSIGKIYTYTNRVVNITQPTTYTFKAEVVGDNGLLKNGAVNVIAREGIDTEFAPSYNGFNLTTTDEVVAYGFEKDNEGVLTPVLYGYYAEFGIDVQQPYFYVGRAMVNGVEYDKWRYITDMCTWESDAQLYYYTNTIIEEVPVDVVPEPYFANANLAAWELKYCLDNDTSRFEWANNSTGKGVIYYLKDEFNNECPYDFKNILFTRKLNENGEYDPLYGKDTMCYTFGGAECDRSIPHDGTYVFHDNVIKDTYWEDEYHHGLSDNVFLSSYHSDTSFYNTIGARSRGNTFGPSCCYNSLEAECQDNVFGKECHYNSCGFCSYGNIFSDFCCTNVLGMYCSENVLERYSSDNRFGDQCSRNVFNEGYNNILGSECANNTFGFECCQNQLGTGCCYNTFGDDCYYNTLGVSCASNSFATSTYNNICEHNIFEINIVSASDGVYIETGCRFIQLDIESGDTMQNIRICQGISGTGEKGRRYLDCPGDLDTPTIYRASGSREIILD